MKTRFAIDQNYCRRYMVGLLPSISEKAFVNLETDLFLIFILVYRFLLHVETSYKNYRYSWIRITVEMYMYHTVVWVDMYRAIGTYASQCRRIHIMQGWKCIIAEVTNHYIRPNIIFGNLSDDMKLMASRSCVLSSQFKRRVVAFDNKLFIIYSC